MLTRFARSATGAFATMTVLLFPVLIGFAGLGIELGFWYTVKRSMQGAADGAAYEAALTFLNGGDAAAFRSTSSALAGRTSAVAAAGTSWSMRLAISAVQPVWCEAPHPRPLSPWKYSWKRM